MNCESGITYENFSRQSGLNAEVLLQRNFDTTKNFSFGLSGSSVINYDIRSGRVFRDNIFLYSINYDQSTKFNIFVNSGIDVLFVNDKPIYHSNHMGYFDNIYFSGNSDLSIGCNVIGELPIIIFEQLNNFSGTQNIITGRIINTTPARAFKINDVYITDNSNLVSISGYTTGEISNTGYVYLEANTGLSYPSGDIGLVLETNFGNVSYSLDADSTDIIIYDEYLQLYPGENYIFSNIDSQRFSVVSFFSTGENRGVDVSLEFVSGCIYSPIEVEYTYPASGYIGENITGGTGNLTGILTGYFSGATGATTDTYSKYYVFTGNYTGIVYATATGLHSGNVTVTGQISYEYNENLVSGDYGTINIGTQTGLITGIYTGLSGDITQYFTFTSSGLPDGNGVFGNGYTGYLYNPYSGSRSLIDPYRLYYSFGVDGLPVNQIANAEFRIARWVYNKSGDPYGSLVTGINSNYYGEIINSGNYVRMSGSTVIYNGYIDISDYDDDWYDNETSGYINSLCGDNTSGYYRIYIGEPSYNSVLTGNIWNINHFSISNFPINDEQNINSTGTGYFDNVYITGNVSEFVTGVDFYTGVTEYPGAAVFSDVWNLRTGYNNLNYTDFKYYNLFTTGIYSNSGSQMLCIPNNRNEYFVEILHNGIGLSGYNVAKLIINDGDLSGVYYFSGKGEFYV